MQSPLVFPCLMDVQEQSHIILICIVTKMSEWNLSHLTEMFNALIFHQQSNPDIVYLGLNQYTDDNR